jgi:cysteine desulfurase
VKRVYLDNAATTPLDPRVVEAMRPFLTDDGGNPSSLHHHGRRARQAVEAARETIAAACGADPSDVIFTSGGSEANNLAVKGVAFANRGRGRHIVVSAIEHDCVLNSCRWLAGLGFQFSLLPVGETGLVRPETLDPLLRPDTILVSVMHANNEIGTVQPVEEIAAICRSRAIPFHTDASQSFGKIPFDSGAMGIDLATVNSHKMYGPKGVGALIARPDTAIEPLIHGGGHERGRRSSTENVAGIVGFARAAALAMEEMEQESRRLNNLRERIIDTVLTRVPAAYLNGDRRRCLPHLVNLGFHGLEGEAIRLLLQLDEQGFSVSSGSACSANDSENQPSHVLTALGRNPVEARGALRVSLGRFNDENDIDQFLAALLASLDRLTPIAARA